MTNVLYTLSQIWALSLLVFAGISFGLAVGVHFMPRTTLVGWERLLGVTVQSITIAVPLYFGLKLMGWIY